jgi:hypothetical protein
VISFFVFIFISSQQDFDDDQQEMITANADELESVQLNQEEEEEEMDEIVINPNNYDEKLDLDEDKQTFVQQFHFSSHNFRIIIILV